MPEDQDTQLIEKMMDGMYEVVNLIGGSWREKAEAVRAYCKQNGLEDTLEEFIAWFPEEQED